MQRAILVAAITGLLVGGLAGYGWWGRKAATDLQAAQQRTAALEQELDRVQTRLRAAESELAAATARLKDLEQHLASEEQQRSRLETLLTHGRK